MYGATAHVSASIAAFDPPAKLDSSARPAWRRTSMKNSRSSAPTYPSPNIAPERVLP